MDPRPPQPREPDDEPLAGRVGIGPELLPAYRALVSTASADATGLASALGVDRAAADALLERLVAEGYATALAADPHARAERRYAAVPPAVSAVVWSVIYRPEEGRSDLAVFEATEIANNIWQDINYLNLQENILPTRERANLILTKGNEHAIEQIKLRK